VTLEELTVAVRAFAVERDWEQFHTPKNLAMAVAGEAGELAAELQWLTPEESQALRPEQVQAVAAEMADVLIYLCRMADVLGVDLLVAANKKLTADGQRYAVADVRGSAQKRS
jgi:NTP pyrophosphatase (non-canonical NTP hydrolase)